MLKYFIVILTPLLIGCGKKNRLETGWNYDSPYSHDTSFYSYNLEDKMISIDEIPRMTKLPDIILDGSAKTHIVQFNKFDSETSWTVFDSTFFQNILEERPMVVLFKKQFAKGESIAYEITEKNIGKYYVECTEATRRCSFQIKIHQ